MGGVVGRQRLEHVRIFEEEEAKLLRSVLAEKDIKERKNAAQWIWKFAKGCPILIKFVKKTSDLTKPERRYALDALLSEGKFFAGFNECRAYSSQLNLLLRVYVVGYTEITHELYVKPIRLAPRGYQDGH